MEKRQDRRIKKHFVVSYGSTGIEQMGLTGDISSRGLRIVTHYCDPVDDIIRLNLAFLDDVLEIAGRVAWRRIPQQTTGQSTISLGIEILRAPPSYQNLLDYLSVQAHFSRVN